MQPVRSLILLAVLAAGTACATANPAERIARLERERAANPSSAATWRSLGIVYYKEGRYDDARRALVEAKRLDANDGTTALYLGMTAERQNDYAAARDAYTTYLNVGRTSRVRGQLERRLAALQRLELAQEAKQAVAREQQLSATPGSPRTVAVMPLRFTGTDSTLQPLERGLAELLITDLARSSQLTVVERARLQALLDEIQLQRAGVTDASTNVRAGRLLQAGRVVQGAIAQRGDQLRVDATVVDVPTTSVAGTTNGDASIDQLFTLEKTIAFGLFNTLGVTLTAAERQAIEQRPTRSLQAFLAYSRALGAEDAGRFDDAVRLFDDAARLDPGFTRAVQRREEARVMQQAAATSVGTVEGSLPGTPEGDVADAAVNGSSGTQGGLAQTVRATTDDINPTPNGPAASGGAGTSTTQVRKDGIGDATGTSNPAGRDAKVIIVIPRP
jgi:TolB-like protein